MQPHKFSTTSRGVDTLLFFLVAGVHLLVALYYKLGLGIDIEANPRGRSWDWFWQALPADLLVNRLWESIFYMHSQPPLFNLYGAIFFNAFPSQPMQAMHYANIVLGALMAGMVYLILVWRTQQRWLSVLIGLALGLDLGVLLFEAYILYDLFTTFWLITSVFFFVRYVQTTRPRDAYLFILTLTVLVLSRSAYHLVLLPVALGLLAMGDSPQRRRVVVTCALICLLAVGWYAKNAYLYGFFGASSWQGYSMWEIASVNYSRDELTRLAEAGVVDRMAAEIEVYTPNPSDYQAFGFNATSPIEVLNRDNMHNINVVQIAQSYQRNALALVRYDPGAYMRAMGLAYRLYSIPTVQHKHHSLNITKVPMHAWLTTKIMQGQIVQDVSGYQFGSIYFLLIPVTLFGYALLLLYQVLRNRFDLVGVLRQHLPELWMLCLIAYTTLIGMCMEIGENHRERFYIEQLVVIVFFILVCRVRAMRQSEPQTVMPSTPQTHFSAA